MSKKGSIGDLRQRKRRTIRKENEAEIQENFSEHVIDLSDPTIHIQLGEEENAPKLRAEVADAQEKAAQRGGESYYKGLREPAPDADGHTRDSSSTSWRDRAIEEDNRQFRPLDFNR